MRIAQIMLAPRFGGAERSFVDLCRALAARGHAVLALGESGGEALRHLEHVPGVEIDDVGCTDKTSPDFPGRWTALLKRIPAAARRAGETTVFL